MIFRDLVLIFPFIACVIAILVLAHEVARLHKTNSNIKVSNKSKNNIPFTVIQNLYFPDQLDFDNYCINEPYLEIFNEFVRLAPSTIEELFSIERSFVVLEKDLDSDHFDVDYADKKFTDIDEKLEKQFKMINRLMTEVNDAIVNGYQDHLKIDLHPNRVNNYITQINRIVMLSETHFLLSFRIMNKLHKQYPQFEERFKVLSRKMIFTYYTGLFGISRMLNEKLMGYYNIEEEEKNE